MSPIVMTVAVFGHIWRGHLVELEVDNMTIVHVLKTSDLDFFLVSHFQFWFSASHIEGKADIIADALSHNNQQYYC